MQPEHEQFLISHVEQMGFFFIIDRFKSAFPTLTHEEACGIYKKFLQKHADEESLKQARTQLQEIGNQLSNEITKALKIKESNG